MRIPESSPAFFGVKAPSEASVIRTVDEMLVEANELKSSEAGKGEPLQGTPLFRVDCSSVGVENATLSCDPPVIWSPGPTTFALTIAGAEPFERDAIAARRPEILMITGVAGSAGTV